MLFKETTVDIGTITSGSKKNPVFWEFDEFTPDNIAKTEDGKYAIKTFCGCTQSPIVNDHGLGVTYNDGGNNSKGKYLHKQVTVYHSQPDTPTRVRNRKNKLIYNPKLPKTELVFKFKVK